MAVNKPAHRVEPVKSQTTFEKTCLGLGAVLLSPRGWDDTYMHGSPPG